MNGKTRRLTALALTAGAAALLAMGQKDTDDMNVWQKIKAKFGGETRESAPVKKMPEGRLVRLHYVRWGMMSAPDFEVNIAPTDEAGKFALTERDARHEQPVEMTIGTAETDALREVMEQEEMYAYDTHYAPAMEVLDGYSWALEAEFEGGGVIASGGANASPGGNGLRRLRDLVEEWCDNTAAE